MLNITTFENGPSPLRNPYQCILWSNAATDYDVKPATGYENKTATQFITGGGFVFNLLLLRMSQNEVDDAYLGGENPGGKAVCGSENKVPLIACAQINDKNHPLYEFSPGSKPSAMLRSRPGPIGRRLRQRQWSLTAFGVSSR